jgi:hypothetical protein
LSTSPAKICSWSHELSWCIHEHSCKFMNSSCSVHQIFYLRFMNKCSWSLVECYSWTVHEQLLNGHSVHELFVFNRIVHECSWMFIWIFHELIIHEKIIEFTWWTYHEILMNLYWFMNVHDFVWWTTMNFSWTVLVDYIIHHK